MRKPPPPPPAARTSRLLIAITVAMGIAALYFAQELLVPVALSALLSFLLAPMADRVERLRVGRVAAVLLVVLVAFSLVGGLAYTVGDQVVSLAENLPKYQDEIVRKVRTLEGTGSGVIDKARKFGNEMSEKVSRPATAPTSAPTTQGPLGEATSEIGRNPAGAVARELQGGPPREAAGVLGSTPENPGFVVALPAPVSPVKTLGAYLGIVLGPLGTAGLVVVFVIFILLEREDLRDRLIRLISRGKYTVTTQALDDAARRISRYVLAQSMVNGSYGLIIGLGLWIIGLSFGHGVGFPSFVLWGLLCAVLRFIPYIGPWIGAAFPAAIALAVFPGFSVFIAVVVLFVVIELISNNVMEPWLYGASTGMSTMAILLAAVFWTWLWGPIGLLMSTPLTVCLVVLGKHVEPLQFLDILLGDERALPPEVSYYQRLLAGDAPEAIAVARSIVDKHGTTHHIPDEVLIPALQMARRDRRNEDLTAQDEADIYDTTDDALDAILREPATPKEKRGIAAAARAMVKSPEAPASDDSLVSDPPDGAPTDGGPSDAGPADGRPLVLGVPAHHRAEELVLRMVGGLVDEQARFESLSTRLLPNEMLDEIERRKPGVVVVAVLPPGGLVQARFLCQKLCKRLPEQQVLILYLGRSRNFDQLLVKMRSAGANYVTTSVLQTRDQALSLLKIRPTDESSAATTKAAARVVDIAGKGPRVGAADAALPVSGD